MTLFWHLLATQTQLKTKYSLYINAYAHNKCDKYSEKLLYANFVKKIKKNTNGSCRI